MLYILVFLLGLIIGYYAVNKRKNNPDGVLRIVKIEKDENPYMFIELDRPGFNSVLAKTQVYLDVVYEDRSSQK